MAKFIELDELPQELVAAIQTDHYTDPSDKPSDYSATKLIAPIQKTELARRYKGTDNLVEPNPLDGFHAWVGSVIHNAIEAAWKKEMGSVVEERFYMDFGDKVVSGKIDCLSGNTIIDWKTCRVYKVMKGDVSEWEKQANIYALLAENNGHKINNLWIFPIIMDLKKHEAKYKPDMPQKPVVKFELRRWSNEEIKAFIEKRIKLLQDARSLTDLELFQLMPCTREEQWSSIKDFAIVPNKPYVKATKVFKEVEGIEAAQQWLSEHEKFDEVSHSVIARYKQRTRCLDYCECKKICQQYRYEMNESNDLFKPKGK